jgi:hypothetical protein
MALPSVATVTARAQQIDMVILEDAQANRSCTIQSAFENTETRLDRDNAIVAVSDPSPKPERAAAGASVAVDDFFDLIDIRTKIPDRIGNRVDRVRSRDHFTVSHDSERGSKRSCFHFNLPSHKECRLNRPRRSEAPVPGMRRCGQAAADLHFVPISDHARETDG